MTNAALPTKMLKQITNPCFEYQRSLISALNINGNLSYIRGTEAPKVASDQISFSTITVREVVTADGDVNTSLAALWNGVRLPRDTQLCGRPDATAVLSH